MWIGERSGKESPQEEVLDLDEANDAEEVEGLRRGAFRVRQLGVEIEVGSARGCRGAGRGEQPNSIGGEGWLTRE